jgi:hypothetical protein
MASAVMVLFLATLAIAVVALRQWVGDRSVTYAPVRRCDLRTGRSSSPWT